MSTTQLRRLRLRLTATYVLVSFVVLALLAMIAVNADSDRRHDELDRRVERTALEADGFAYPQGDPSKLVVDRTEEGFFGPRPSPGAAPVIVVDVAGTLVAGPPGTLDGPAARRVLERASRRDGLQLYGEATAGAKVRVAASAIRGTEGLLAVVAAVEELGGTEDDIRAATLRIAGITLGLWVLTAAVGWLLTGRALAPAAAQAKREEAFLADAAHELRTPVAVIRARAEQALREHGPSSPAAGALQAIERAAERASGTIADMLELARLDARRGRMEREPLRLDLLLEQVTEEYEDQAKAAGAKLELQVAGEAVVQGDERLLARSIANLVENAIRYGGVGGTIDIALELEAAQAVVVVSDRGPGVPPAQRAAVFDRFHRASSAAGGSGLGLPIARLVAEAHDGSLELLADIEGQPGARFALRLPLLRPTGV